MKIKKPKKVRTEGESLVKSTLARFGIGKNAKHKKDQ
jgi:hypothetical protein